MDKDRQYIEYLENLLRLHQIPHFKQQEFHQNQPKTQKSTQNKQPPLHTNLVQSLQGEVLQRYSRQMLMKQISYQGQLKIIKSRVAVVGAGGIGCPLAMYLAAAGVGCIGLFDQDKVQITNLHRQVGHRTKSIGIPKTTSLKQTILQINPLIKVQQNPYITIQNVSLLDGYDLVIDGSDNPLCRYLVNDYMMSRNKSYLSGACVGWQAQVTIYGGNSPCYRCVWGNDQKTMGNCSSLGVVGMLPGIVGLLLAVQAMKMLTGRGSSLQGRLLTYDGRTSVFRNIKLRHKKHDCIACGQKRMNMKQYDYSKYAVCSTPAATLDVQQVTWNEYVNRKEEGKLLDVRPSNIFNIVHLDHSTNIPYDELLGLKKQEIWNRLGGSEDSGLFVSCARGVMSKKAVVYLQTIGIKGVNVQGGLFKYGQLYDPTIPTL